MLGGRLGTGVAWVDLSVIKLGIHSDPVCQVLVKRTLFVFMMSPI